MSALARHIPRGEHWRLVVFFARGRGLLTSALIVVVLAALFGGLRGWAAFDAYGYWGDFEITKQFALVQVIPALLAGVIGMSMWSPLGESERTAAFPLWWLRMAQVLALTTLALAVSLPLLAGWESRIVGLSPLEVVGRNLLGLVGVALLIGWAFDARWSWIGPLSCTAVAIARLFRVGPEELWRGEWLSAGQDDIPSWIVSGALFAVGLGLFARYGAKDVEGEAE